MKNLLLGILLAVSSMVYSQETELFTTYGDILNGKEEFTLMKVYISAEDGESWVFLSQQWLANTHNLTLPCNRMHLISFVNGDEEKFLYIHNYEKGEYPLTVNFDYKDISAVITKVDEKYTHFSGTEEELFGKPVEM